MYAIVESGGKQYKVKVGDVVSVEKIDAPVAEKITLDALMVCEGDKVQVGKPGTGVKVVAEVVEHGKGTKLQIAVYKKMNGHHRAQGHRQPYSKIKIISIGK